jgi:hypothetical protein
MESVPMFVNNLALRSNWRHGIALDGNTMLPIVLGPASKPSSESCIEPIEYLTTHITLHWFVAEDFLRIDIYTPSL